MEKFWTLLFLIEILMFLICTVYSCFYECLNSFFELENFIFWTRKVSYSYEFHNFRTQKGAIMIHDCIYQFLRLFYHSRFKPQQLEMTKTQFVAPVLDLVLVLPLILRLFKDFSRFSNATKMKIQSKPEINGQPLMSFYDF